MICTTLVPGVAWPTPQAPQATYEEKKAVVVRRYSAPTLSQRIESALRDRASITTPKLKKMLDVPQSSLHKVLHQMREVGAVRFVNSDGTHTLSLGDVKFRHVRTGSDSMLSKKDVDRVLELRSKGVPWIDITTKYKCVYETIRRAIRLREMLA